MVEVSQRATLRTCFAMSEPQHMLSKLVWEMKCLGPALSVWEDNEEAPSAVFIAFNTAVTAWHITDWLWQSSPENRAILVKRFGLSFIEGKDNLRKGLKDFQDAIAAESRPLHICREIATASKHMGKTKSDPDIRAAAKWNQIVERAGYAKPGDRVMSLVVSDGSKQQDAQWLFIEAFGYWEKLFTSEKLISAEARLPDRIIREILHK